MKRLVFLSLLLLSPAFAQDGFKPLFNGKDLTGWDGNPELWKVENGEIVGNTTGPEQLAYNQFLIWRGGVVKNFELRVKVKQKGNNTGIQYRSREFPEAGKWSVGGYQCDIHSAAPNNAMVYGEAFGDAMTRMFRADVAASAAITLAAWRERPLADRALEGVARLFEGFW